ncbi:DEAD/DEAH box helicase [Cellulomonas sp. B6]|uniref:DEAD/DEAH box helicase n=1 Tax=Cellulomonas sp. B6 TaxID=1295626 RepID=UPI0016810D34|nr:DEAD/DEAH box helicase family protein [Cellulomonas sp. B6]
MSTKSAVLDSYVDAVSFQIHGAGGGLRRPQVGALHSIIGYQASGVTDPAIVVMPTGTGKTETMVAWMVATQPEAVLVIVPSDVLREQIAGTFETLGILQEVGAVAPGALRPRVVRLGHRIADEDEALELVASANVIVATPKVLSHCEPEVRQALFAACSHLVVDEAHHAPARTWSEIIDAFAGRPVLLFTATPFRTDRRVIPGRTIFRFPLRLAQEQDYFSKIDFTAVLGTGDPDEDLAAAAVQRLRSDRAAGLEHVMLARARDRAHAEELHDLYTEIARDLQPRIVHEGLTKKAIKSNLADLRSGICKIVVCVDMLGEGFDLQTLKVAAFHEARRSLSPMIQLIGRVARVSTKHKVGTASVFVKREPEIAWSPMRYLLREDADWNSVLSNISEQETARAEEEREFANSFPDHPADIPVGLLEPKMSAVAFETSVADWAPEAARTAYGDRILDGVVSTSRHGDLAWFVLEVPAELRWGRIPSLQVASYNLVIMFLDVRHGLLFVHGSDTKKDYAPLAEAVLGHPAVALKGKPTFRVFGGVDRVVPTNVGLLDPRDREARFALFVGSNVENAIRPANGQPKSRTHIAASGYDTGNRVTIAAAMSGRFWSMRAANGLLEWRNWCVQQGARLTDRTIDVDAVFGGMLVPTPVTARPAHPLLAVEWPWELYLGNGTALRLEHDGKSVMITDADFEIDDHGTTGPFRFTVVTPDWRLGYTASVGQDGVHYLPVCDEAQVSARRGEPVPLSDWLNAHKPTLYLSGDRMITGDDHLVDASDSVEPFDRNRLEVRTWDGVDIRVESQGDARRADSIQAYVARELLAEQDFDVLIDDDRAGEAADLVGLRIDGSDLVITLVHCKYSVGSTPGARVDDLYDVCGQATRGARWRDHGGLPLLKHLDRRVRAYYRRHNRHPLEVGTIEDLYRVVSLAPQLYPRFVTVVAQPGISKVRCSAEQLRLLAGAESYLRAITKGPLRVLVSE